MKIRVLVAGMLVSSLIVFWGCRQIWRSLGASSEALVIDIADVHPGTPLADRHVDLENFIPLVGNAFQEGSTVYIPLAPLPAEGIPDKDFDLQALARDTRLFATFSEDNLEVVREGKGLIMGTAEMEFKRELRNALKRELQIGSVNEIEVIEFGRGPSILWGMLLLVGGILGLFGTGYVGISTMQED